MKLLHEELTDQIIAAYFKVYNRLGYGFLEKLYERAMIIELGKAGFHVASQVPIKVFYEGEDVGDYFADLVVNELVVVEIKAVDALHEVHQAQLLNYLKATTMEVGLLFNFGIKPKFVRKLFTNDQKHGQVDSVK